MKSRRVLLVDDDADFCSALATGLGARGHDIVVVRDGASALASVRAAAPDIILVDITLPDRSGFSLARDLRSIAPTALIMGMTAHAVSPTQDQLDCGISCMFLKPLELGDLARLIEGWSPPP
jgi:DNA-binding response OmpR family regulator